MKIIPYGRHTITDDDIQAVVETLQSDFLTQGPKVLEFEDKFSKYVDSDYAVAVSNGTAALHLSVLTLGIKPGQKVITSPITFVASANCILYAGGVPDFVDIDPKTATIDLNLVEEKLKKSKPNEYAGIIPVDFSGYPVDMERVRSLADQYGLWVLEDACHAPGASFINSNSKECRSGSGEYADLAIFSFHPVKHIATGEGGMITTRNRKLYETLLLLRTHGITKDSSRFLNRNENSVHGYYYEMQDLGFNYRMPDILASLGISQLKRANEGLRRRKEIAKIYDEAFCDNQSNCVPLYLGKISNGHAYHLYIIQTENRDNFYEELRAKNIYTQVHYIPIHLQPYYQNLGWKQGDFYNAELYYSKTLSLPMYAGLLDEDIERVLSTIINCS
jgi:UDP-4-amino-4,6-dideoxy-N-acetyl-beta-L-altrosamine transaminase